MSKELEQKYGSDLAEAIEDIGIFKTGSVNDIMKDVNEISNQNNKLQISESPLYMFSRKEIIEIIEELIHINNNISELNLSLSCTRDELTNRIQKIILRLKRGL